ncbi:hypothetical protein HK100_011761 [Physocladia obscura]|uniref:chitin synthase n=1 Tax=Physocladia obscura TaxID=109957 RepID=A0AAD5T1D7_9FUNG|nr:hypothetical protein HK100_011761 [Physocladia obscura]
MLRSPSADPPAARIGATRFSDAYILQSSYIEIPQVPQPKPKQKASVLNIWALFSKALTCCVLNGFLQILGKKNVVAQQAWREKVALCFVIFLLCFIVGFLTFGLVHVLCPALSEETAPYFNDSSLNFSPSNSMDGQILINGFLYNSSLVTKVLQTRADITISVANFTGNSMSLFFTPSSHCLPYSSASWDCLKTIADIVTPENIAIGNSEFCASVDWLEFIPRQRVTFSWADISAYSSHSGKQITVFNNVVLNITEIPAITLPFTNLLQRSAGLDITLPVYSDSTNLLAPAFCLQERAIIGFLASTPPGCITSTVIQSISLLVILALVFTKFFMAVYFYWIVAPRLIKSKPTRHHVHHVSPYPHPHPYTIMLVTCYSESEPSIRATMDSLAATTYPDDRKLLFVVADGIVTGAGNRKSTPDIVLGLIEIETRLPYPQPAAYVAIADGVKQRNMGYVYSGRYVHSGHDVPVVVVVKCGAPEERDSAKPGNRGKRDSQLILMNCLSRCLFDDRMTRLDYEIQFRIMHLMKVHPSQFEYVLMVDADTDVHADALKFMIQVMINDRNIMGLCGETRIRNKWTSWVTAIQVFEYFSSHHLGKAFESIFGGVTCLPGCFCMYRIKIQKDLTGRFVPLLVNPDIVQEYSENVVETLHKKNLLLLGEDRFLSTLMLRNFPRRKMMFVPQAICHTVVPDEFGVELIGTLVLPAAISFTIFLLIQTVITSQVQMIPMLLLVFVLGLPGFLVVLTNPRHKAAYLWWLGVYIFALPVWNFVLPLYAFWHFDDFSWGQTRMVDGETKGRDHDEHGECESIKFDPSSVILKSLSIVN